MGLDEYQSSVWEDAWITIATPQQAWIRNVHDALKQHLPTMVPLNVWANFEFISTEGAAFDVDLLILTPTGVYLIELFNESEQITVDEHHWIIQRRNVEVIDTPLKQAQQKANRLHQALDRATFKKYKAHAPSIIPLVLLVNAQQEVHFQTRAANKQIVFMPEANQTANIIDALSKGLYPGSGGEHKTLTSNVLERLDDALDMVGIDHKTQRVDGWVCERLLDTSQSHQDYLATRKADGLKRRVRTFISRRDISASRQQQLHHAARREFEVLETLKHHNILQAEQWIDHKARPAVVFEHIDGARLDLLLQVREDWGTRARLTILRKLTDAILYAHRNNVIHRALSPASVLVYDLEAVNGPKVKLYNWQMALNVQQRTGTQHIADYLSEGIAVYLAPEFNMGYEAAEATDVWGLGCIAYALFTGFAPASDLPDLNAKLIRDGGLRASAQVDGIPQALDDLIFKATHPTLRHRLSNVEAFRTALEEIWRDIVGENTDDTPVDPREAHPGDVLEDRWVVVQKLGSGASAVALLVDDEDGSQRVLKVARTSDDAIRLEREARVLEKLSDTKEIVTYHGTVDVHGHQALVLDYAGQTLRQALAEASHAGLSLDDLRRYGRDLCQVLLKLERQNVLHRDIKPANIGMGNEKKSAKQLKLFDFSLAGTPLEQIHVGTSVYRDPFLPARNRWDEQADRYSGALTLYEMATGTLPTWGDGTSSPLFDTEATLQLEPELFDPSVRDDLVDFFERALHRDLDQRFLSANEMKAMWKSIFKETTTSHTSEHTLVHVGPDTSLSSLGCSAAASEALDRLNIITVLDLLSFNRQAIHFQRGTSHAVRREIDTLRQRLQEHMPSLARTQPTLQDDNWEDATLEQFLNLAIDQKAEDLIQVLGAKNIEQAKNWRTHTTIWPTRTQMAEQAGLPLADFNEFFDQSIEQWAREPRLEPLRRDVLECIARNGGIASAKELTIALLYQRSTITDDMAQRRVIGSAIARIAVEAELLARANGDDLDAVHNFGIQRVNHNTFIYTKPRLARALESLGQKADELSSGQTLRSSKRAIEALLDVLQATGAGTLRSKRVIHLAAQASQHTALSVRDELYPVDLSADRALKHTKGALTGKVALSVQELRDRVASRYPEAQPLPGIEDVDQIVAMLEAQNINLRWDEPTHQFVSKVVPSPLSTQRTAGYTSLNPTGIDFDLRAFIKDLHNAYDWGGFRVLMVDPRYLQQAEARLRASFPALDVLNTDALWLDTMNTIIDQHPKLDWSRVLAADAPEASSKAKRNLHHLLRHKVHPLLQETLNTFNQRDILLTQPGLFGRYADTGSMNVLEDLGDVANTPNGPRLVWLLLPADRQSNEPRIGDVAVPRTSPSQITRLSGRWIRHNAQSNT